MKNLTCLPLLVSLPPFPSLGQCEFSFTKTQMVMDMNKREMERYEQVYRSVDVSSGKRVPVK